jgi:electron transfer flavoprotein alpha subunit
MTCSAGFSIGPATPILLVMLAVLPVRDGALPAGGLEVVAECCGRALVIGSGARRAAELLSGAATDVTVVEAGDFAPAAWAAFLGAQLGDGAGAAASGVVLPASPDGRDLAPRLAAALRCDLFAGAISVTPSLVQLARHGGLTILDAHAEGRFVATLQPGVRGVDIDPAMAQPEIHEVDYLSSGEHADATVVEVLAPDAATMDLAESPRILGGGAGLRTADAFAQLSELATRLEASMGATRVISDRGWVQHERQIGTTGVVVDPQLYLAFGISGAVQHTSGLGQPEHIISVNTDPHCPMMQLADLAVVSDANAVVAALLERTAHG